jgi:hypothetical protein
LTRIARPRLGAVGYAWPSPTPASLVVSIANLSRTTRFCGMLKSSMFAEMPLDNRTVVQFAVQTAIAGFRGPPDTLPETKRLKISSRLAVL